MIESPKLSIEEVANTFTHGFGLLLSLAGFVLLVVMASYNGGFWYVLSSVIYGASLVILYAASTLYHGATDPTRKKRLQIVDHCCIYLLIAGSYTPFTLIVLRETVGMRLFIFIWVFAALGIGAKLIFGARYPVISVISFLLMGWVGLVAFGPLLHALGYPPVVLVLGGGVAYSLGVVFFSWTSIKHHHAIWHLFVLTGSICHFLAVAIYVLPFVAKA
jgi:hemolysin III